MAADMLPTRAHLIPSIGNPAGAPALEYEAARNPRMRMTVPVPVAGRPDVAVARRGSPLVACRRRCGIGIVPRRDRPDSTGTEPQRDQHCLANGLHSSHSSAWTHLTTQVGVSRTSTMPPVKQKLHRPVQS